LLSKIVIALQILQNTWDYPRIENSSLYEFLLAGHTLGGGWRNKLNIWTSLL